MEISFDKWLAPSKEGFSKTQRRLCCDTRKGKEQPYKGQQSLRATTLTNWLIECIPRRQYVSLFALVTASKCGGQWWCVQFRTRFETAAEAPLTNTTTEGIRKGGRAKPADTAQGAVSRANRSIEHFKANTNQHWATTVWEQKRKGERTRFSPFPLLRGAWLSGVGPCLILRVKELPFINTGPIPDIFKV